MNPRERPTAASRVPGESGVSLLLIRAVKKRASPWTAVRLTLTLINE